MSGIIDLLNSDMGRQIIQGVSNQTGAPENKTADVLGSAIPLLLGAMQRNASSQQGAEGLLSALSSNKHDGSLLDNLSGFFGGGVDNSAISDGAGILGHVLGNKQPAVENALSRKSGLDAGTITQILKIAAPLIMAYLGKQTRTNQVSSSNDIGGLLGNLMGSQPKQEQSLITSLLDADGDGSMIDDVAGMVLGGNKKKGGLGGMLGGLFGNK
ncbi:DUF937 domain-containing protein [Zhouia spongiae]|uniref:DUF937 domain-containing protein n=1 Tax=Zhouia spongiae TaxID=2202721 RepID=A0ABY3YJY3_9FLAO|nr:DUF937 domain-containing protein [Zhouia spongiae]UNY98119.1 DUF937 domain-containing protein [Zhouia spongiae]